MSGIEYAHGIEHLPMTKMEVREKKRLNEEQIGEHLKKAELVKMETLFNKTAEQCVDGRCRHEAIGTPGGNMGEFILALASAEKVSGYKFSEDEIKNILTQYLESFGKFYWHTDEHATHALGHDFDPMNVAEEKMADVIKPEAIGCGHIKKMLLSALESEKLQRKPNEEENERSYGARADLIKSTIQQVYRLARERKDLVEIETLQGEHEEGAVLQVKIEGKIDNDTMIPTVPPFDDETMTFVYHPDVVQYMREATADDVIEIIAKNSTANVNKADFVGETKYLGDKMTGLTVGALAKGLPVYEAAYVNGKWAVNYVQDVK